MTKSAETFKTIIMYFGILKYYISLRTKQGYVDDNKDLENLIRPVLNLTFGYQLVNANQIVPNHPAVDLIDTTNQVCFQITSDSSLTKIKKTLGTFFDHNLDASYDTLFIFTLSNKPKYRSTPKTQRNFAFSPNEHVMDTEDLIRIIDQKSQDDPDLLESICNSLNENLDIIRKTLNEDSSLLSVHKQKKGQPPATLNFYRTILEYEDNLSSEQELNYFIELHKNISQLPIRCRELFLMLLESTQPATAIGGNPEANPIEVAERLELDERSKDNYLKMLYNRGFIDESLSYSMVEVRFHTQQLKDNLLPSLKDISLQVADKYCIDALEWLKELLVDANFSLLDNAPPEPNHDQNL